MGRVMRWSGGSRGCIISLRWRWWGGALFVGGVVAVGASGAWVVGGLGEFIGFGGGSGVDCADWGSGRLGSRVGRWRGGGGRGGAGGHLDAVGEFVGAAVGVRGVWWGWWAGASGCGFAGGVVVFGGDGDECGAGVWRGASAVLGELRGFGGSDRVGMHFGVGDFVVECVDGVSGWMWLYIYWLFIEHPHSVFRVDLGDCGVGAGGGKSRLGAPGAVGARWPPLRRLREGAGLPLRSPCPRGAGVSAARRPRRG